MALGTFLLYRLFVTGSGGAHIHRTYYSTTVARTWGVFEFNSGFPSFSAKRKLLYLPSPRKEILAENFLANAPGDVLHYYGWSRWLQVRHSETNAQRGEGQRLIKTYDVKGWVMGCPPDRIYRERACCRDVLEKLELLYKSEHRLHRTSYYSTYV